MVQGDADATSHNLLAKELLFRTGIVSNLISYVLFLFLALVLFRIFKKVNDQKANTMVALFVAQIPIAFIAAAFNFTALMILKGEVTKSLEPHRAQDLAMIFLKTYDYIIKILEIFWGLWFIPFGELVYRSGFIPRLLGIFLAIGGIAYIIDSLKFLLFPGYFELINQVTLICYEVAEISTMLWLLIRAVKNNISIIGKN